MSFRLLTYNICRGGRGREDRLGRVIAEWAPDLVVLQEATRPAQVERIARCAGMQQWASRPRQSLGFLARTRVVKYAWYRPRLSRHAFLEVLPNGLSAPVIGVHLSAVHAAWTERRRVIELRALLRAIKAHEHGFHLLAGDFNTLAPGELLDVRKLPHRLRALVWLSGGRVRWKTIQLVLDAGYADVFRGLHPDTPGLTFPAWDPHIRLDFVFSPAPHMPRVRSCTVIDDPHTRKASDHLPVVVEIEELDETSA